MERCLGSQFERHKWIFPAQSVRAVPVHSGDIVALKHIAGTFGEKRKFALLYSGSPARDYAVIGGGLACALVALTERAEQQRVRGIGLALAAFFLLGGVAMALHRRSYLKRPMTAVVSWNKISFRRGGETVRQISIADILQVLVRTVNGRRSHWFESKNGIQPLVPGGLCLFPADETAVLSLLRLRGELLRAGVSGRVEMTCAELYRSLRQLPILAVVAGEDHEILSVAQTVEDLRLVAPSAAVYAAEGRALELSQQLGRKVLPVRGV